MAEGQIAIATWPRPGGRGLPAEPLEVDQTLLDERVPALHRLLGLVIEVERGMGELRHAGALLGVDVERLLGERQRRRALLEQLGAPLLHLRAQVLRGTTVFTSPIASASCAEYWRQR